MTDPTHPEGWTILVVDDERDIRAHLTRVLLRDIPGVRVVTATNGREGLDALARENVDLIVSDQRMPEMGGVEFLAQAARHHPGVPRVLLTGFADFDVAKRAVNEGHISAFFEKPAKNGELVATLANLLEARRDEILRQRAIARGIDAARRKTIGPPGKEGAT